MQPPALPCCVPTAIAIEKISFTQPKKMALKSPDDILQTLHGAMETILGESELSPSMRRKIYEDLAEVYNYVSAASRKPSLTNTIYSQSAHAAKIEAQIKMVGQVLDDHKKFVEKNFDKAEQYFRTIQLGGYAGFFAIWAIVREWVNPITGSVSAIFMLLSVAVFAAWELSKVYALSKSMKWHSSITKSSGEAFLEQQFERFWKEKPSIEFLSMLRPRFLVCSIVSAVMALVLLLGSLLYFLGTQIF